MHISLSLHRIVADFPTLIYLPFLEHCPPSTSISTDIRYQTSKVLGPTLVSVQTNAQCRFKEGAEQPTHFRTTIRMPSQALSPACPKSCQMLACVSLQWKIRLCCTCTVTRVRCLSPNDSVAPSMSLTSHFRARRLAFPGIYPFSILPFITVLSWLQSYTVFRVARCLIS
jgi:hypothetical protein